MCGAYRSLIARERGSHSHTLQIYYACPYAPARIHRLGIYIDSVVGVKRWLGPLRVDDPLPDRRGMMPHDTAAGDGGDDCPRTVGPVNAVLWPIDPPRALIPATLRKTSPTSGTALLPERRAGFSSCPHRVRRGSVLILRASAGV